MTTAEKVARELGFDAVRTITEEAHGDTLYVLESKSASGTISFYESSSTGRMWRALLSKSEQLEQATKILIDSVSAIGGQAVEGVSLEFLANLPAEIKGKLEQVEQERDEARNQIPHQGDGSCDHCGKVPSVAIATNLCNECVKVLKRAEQAEAELADAVAAEQERCAKIAESQRYELRSNRYQQIWTRDEIDGLCKSVQAAVAATIRAQGTPSPAEKAEWCPTCTPDGKCERHVGYGVPAAPAKEPDR
jgi:hypothetical protein